MTLNVDLTDVAAHAVFNNELTGIQRVQIEYARALVRSHPGRTHVFSKAGNVHHDLRSHFVEDGRTTSDIFADIRRTYRFSFPFPIRPLLKQKLASRRGAVTGPAPKAGFDHEDTLYIGGAFWAHPRSIAAYERAARAGCDVVVMFHDFIPLTFPHFASSRARPAFERMLRLPARTITISEHTRSQLEDARRAIKAPAHLAPPTVVPLAHEFSAAPRNHAPSEPPSLRAAMLDRMGPFALCVGTVEVRKNHGRLLKLWEGLAREAGPGWPKLFIAGKAGWRAGEALRMLRRADRDAPYLWVEEPTDKELAWLYGRSAFTVFPSLAEGWGLPIGESLWFGKPCVASNATSMPEVGGTLCFYGDPHDIDTFAAPIIRLVREPEFHASAVARIRASCSRTWAQAAGEVVAAVSPAPPKGRPLPLRESPPPDEQMLAPVE